MSLVSIPDELKHRLDTVAAAYGITTEQLANGLTANDV